MTIKRVWLVVAILGVVGVLVLGWFVLVQPMVSGALQAEAEASQIEASNADLEAQIALLAKDYEGISDLRMDLDDVLASVPGDVELAEVIRQINAAQAESGSRIVSMSFGNAVPYVPAVSQVAATQSPATDATSDEDESEASPVQPVPVGGSAGVAPTDTADAQRLSAAGLVLVPIDIQLSGNPGQILAFAKALQDMSRLFLVVAVEAIDGEAPTGSITGYIYVLPLAFKGVSEAEDDESTTTTTTTTTPTPTATVEPTP